MDWNLIAKQEMACIDLRIDSAREMDDDLHPIYNYLKRRGWGDALDLLSCTNSKLPNDFLFDEDNYDPFRIIIRPIEHPTELFMAIQQSDWGAALNCLHRKPAEARTWIYRETDFPENTMLWKLLPLHASIALGAPAYFILELLHVYPDAAKKRDLKNSLPIHLAASRIDIHVDGERILQQLLRVFPESAGVVNGRGKLPIELAYGAQLRKDKRSKAHSWCIDTRETEEEGFELQLEMRDVMESFKGQSEHSYPPTWSVPGPTNSSSSTSSRSEISFDKIAYRFLSSTYAKLATISESNSKAASPVSSRSSSSSSTEEMKSIGFQSIHLNNHAQPSSSSISLRSSIDSSIRSLGFSQRSTRSSSSSALSKLRSLLSRSSSMEGKKSANGCQSVVNHLESESRTKTDSETIELETVISSSESKTSGGDQHQNTNCLRARSYELPRMQLMYSSPAMSLPIQSMITGSHSSSKEKKSSANRPSFYEDSDDNGERAVDPIELQESLSGCLKSSRSQQHQDEVYEHENSFGTCTKQLMYSSPARSLPTPIRSITSFTRSKNHNIECNTVDEVSSVGDETKKQKDSDSIDTIKSSSNHVTPKQQQNLKGEARSVDLPPMQSIYSSASRSLTTPFRVFNSRSQRTEMKASYLRADSLTTNSKSGKEEKSSESICRKNSFSESLEPKWFEQYQQTHSFETPVEKTMYCSPARSFPSRFIAIKSNPSSLDRKKDSVHCVPFVSDYTSDNEETSESKGVKDSMLRSLKPNWSEQEENVCKHARSFDRPPQIMYSFPSKSLPLPVRICKLGSRTNEKLNCSNSNDKKSSGENEMTHSESFQLGKSVLGSLKSNPSQVNTHSFDVFTELPLSSLPVTSFPSPSALPEIHSCRPKSEYQSTEKVPRNKSDMITEVRSECIDLRTTPNSTKVNYPKKGPNGNMRSHSFILHPYRSLPSSPTKSLPADTMRSNIECCFDKNISGRCTGETDNHIIQATKSEGHECSYIRGSASNHLSENLVEDMTLKPIEGDPILVDFIEEAISNIGRERSEIEYVLRGMHEKRINKIDDLLKIASKVLAASFGDKELAMEMKRLLDEPEFENSFHANYEDADFLLSAHDAGLCSDQV